MNNTVQDMACFTQVIRDILHFRMYDELKDWILKTAQCYVSRLRLSCDIADDIAQEASIKLLRMPVYDIAGTKSILKSYMWDIAKHYQGYRRKSKNRRRIPGEDAYEKVRPDFVSLYDEKYSYQEEQYSIYTESAEDAFVSNEEYHTILNVIKECNNSEILYERLIIHLSPDEIQEKHNLTPNQYRGRYCRALDELKIKLIAVTIIN